MLRIVFKEHTQDLNMNGKGLDWKDLITAFSLIPHTATAKFVDDEGDTCTVSSDVELAEALSFAKSVWPQPLTLRLEGQANAAAPPPLSPSLGSMSLGHDVTSAVGRALMKGTSQSVQQPQKNIVYAAPRSIPIAGTVTEPVSAPQIASTPVHASALAADVTWKNQLTFYLNGKQVVIANPDPNMLLVDYLRDVAKLKGTKIGCAEGGCGACTVVLGFKNPRTGADEFKSANSCLRPLCAVDGMAVWTVEGIGSQRKGFHAVQERLAKCNGTQCGFCSPGWVMNMYGLLRSADKSKGVSCQEVEDYFDGNLCRCTGYRPIFNAFKTFASDAAAHADTQSGLTPPASELPPYSPSSEPPLPPALNTYTPVPLAFTSSVSDPSLTPNGATKFYRPTSLVQLLSLLSTHELGARAAGTLKMMVGNTSIGVSKYYNGTAPYNRADQADVIVDLRDVPELGGASAQGSGLLVGATTTLNDLIALLEANASKSDTFGAAAAHISKVANNQVRNMGSWAGNLMLARSHSDFPSDVALTLWYCGATVQVIDVDAILRSSSASASVGGLSGAPPATVNMSIGQLLRTPGTQNVVIVSVSIPFLPEPSAGSSVVAKSYKIMQRAQNAHAHVNAGFVMQLGPASSSSSSSPSSSCDVGASYAVVDTPVNTVKAATIVIGGVSKRTFRAAQTEAWLVGKDITAEATMLGALPLLEKDLGSTDVNGGGGPSAAFGDQAAREGTLKGLWYKFVLNCQPGGAAKLPASLQSAAAPPARPISSGSEVFTSDPTDAPVGQAIPKMAGSLQTSGEATYTDDMPLPEDALHGAVVFATTALGTITSIDTAAARKMEGVVDVLTAADIPNQGSNVLPTGTPASDPNQDELFVPVGGVVKCVGQMIACVLATSREAANAAAARVIAQYGPAYRDPVTLELMSMAAGRRALAMGRNVAVASPILSLRDAIEKKAFMKMDPDADCSKIERTQSDQGIDAALAASKHMMSGEVVIGGQKHFYFEPHTSLALPGTEGETVVMYSATQGQTLLQACVANVLGLTNNAVSVRTRRCGGGFGGKLTRCIPNACMAAIGMHKHGVPVRVTNDRATDFQVMGGREPMIFEYKVGYDDTGLITALQMDLYSDAGFCVEQSWGCMDMAILWCDNTYYFSNYQATAKVCQTNLPTNTAMRSPGVVQSVFATEAVLQRVAVALGLAPTQVQEKNFLRKGQTTPYLETINYCTIPEVWSGLKKMPTTGGAGYDAALAAVSAFNAANRWRKRGISMTPTKFGMAFPNYQSGATVRIFGTDGTVKITTGGIEIGQGLNTKVAQMAAFTLGCPYAIVQCGEADTDLVPNNSMTGGSGTSESSCMAMRLACQQLATRLAPYLKQAQEDGEYEMVGAPSQPQQQQQQQQQQQYPQPVWAKAVAAAAAAGVSLSADGWYAPQKVSPAGAPLSKSFDYFIYCAACSIVEVDILTGETTVLESNINYDCGSALNPAVDIGQIEGAFIMGLGYFLTEEVVTDDTGRLLSNGTWDYKPPCSHDIPVKFSVNLLKNAPNPVGVLGSKAVGEPPYAVASSVYFAVKHAVKAAREQAGHSGPFDLPVPASVNAVQQACMTDPSLFKLS